MSKPKSISKIIADHQHYLAKDVKGWLDMRATFYGRDFRNTAFDEEDLRYARFEGDFRYCTFRKSKLGGAIFSGSNLHDANFAEADVSIASFDKSNLAGAVFYSANLEDAYLHGADCQYASFKKANLQGTIITAARLRMADFTDAYLQSTFFSESDITGAIFDKEERVRFGQVLDKPIIGYKRTLENVIITAEIPAGAVVFSINNLKCRTNKARIIDMQGCEVLHSIRMPSFKYRLNDEICIPDFNMAYNLECATGFHFFRTLEEAELC